MKETKIESPVGCEVDKIETQDGHIVITFKEKEPQLPRTWEEFCKMYSIKGRECHIDNSSGILNFREIGLNRDPTFCRNVLPDRAIAEAVADVEQVRKPSACKSAWLAGLDAFDADSAFED